MTRAEALDEALAFGWIDGVAHGIDEESWSVRFSRRKTGSNWSHINIRRIGELREAGRMHAAGEAALAARREDRTGVYSFEQAVPPAFTPEQEAEFRSHPAAWAWFEKQGASYRRPAIWWVISAKQEATRERRLKTLIADSAEGRRIKLLTRPEPKPKQPGSTG